MKLEVLKVYWFTSSQNVIIDLTNREMFIPFWNYKGAPHNGLILSHWYIPSTNLKTMKVHVHESLFYCQTVKFFINSWYFWYSYIGTDTSTNINTGASLALIWKHSKIVLFCELVVISVASYLRYKHHIPFKDLHSPHPYSIYTLTWLWSSLNRVYPFTGLDHWTGLLDSNFMMKYQNFYIQQLLANLHR